MRELPSGTVTLLFTDIEGSTKLLHELGERYADLLADHRRVVREAVARHGGVEVDTQGDAFFVAFSSAGEAVSAAEEAQKDLGPIRVRMGLHTGEQRMTEEGYVGLDIHRAARIASAAHGGQIVLSRATSELLDPRFRLRDLGEHRLKDLVDSEWLFQLGNEEFPPLKSLSTTNLPLPTNRLIGRDQELAELRDLLLTADHRLVTVTGSGGTGKTRLAVRVGLDLLAEFPNGVFFVELAPIEDAAFVVPELARILGVRESVAEPLLQTMGRSLLDKRLLLVIDNFEHLLDAASALTTLLQGAAGLFVLATSRERLGLSGEREYSLRPLETSAAVSLFLERARAVRADVTSDESVVEICRRLDGLPLALELAAARVKMLSAQQLLERLERRLPLLTGGPRDVPGRQRALQATIEWSYELLNERGRADFARLGIFAGEFPLDAAEEVCRLDVDEVGSLVDKSLVHRTESGHFFMLQTIREFAFAQLETSGKEEELRRRHAAYHLDWLRTSGLSWWEGGSLEWRLAARERGADLRAALTWALGHEPELGVELASSLQGFWFVDGSWSEGARWFQQALARTEDLPPAVRAKALTGASEFARFRHEHERALALKQEALSLYRKLDDPSTLAAVLKDLGETAMMLGDHALADESVRDVGAATHSLAEVARRRGDAERAAELYAQGLELGLELDAPPLIGECIEGLAGVAWMRGDARRAARLSAAVDAYFVRSGSVLNYAAEHDGLIDDVRTALGVEGFEVAWAEGRTTKIEAAIDEARAVLEAQA